MKALCTKNLSLAFVCFGVLITGGAEAGLVREFTLYDYNDQPNVEGTLQADAIFYPGGSNDGGDPIIGAYGDVNYVRGLDGQNANAFLFSSETFAVFEVFDEVVTEALLFLDLYTLSDEVVLFNVSSFASDGLNEFGAVDREVFGRYGNHIGTLTAPNAYSSYSIPSHIIDVTDIYNEMVGQGEDHIMFSYYKDPTFENAGDWARAQWSSLILPYDPSSDIPEPTTLTLMGLALAGLGLQRRRKKA